MPAALMLLKENWPKACWGLLWEAVAVFASACHWFLRKKGSQHGSSMGCRAGMGAADGAAERSWSKTLRLQGAERRVFEVEVML